jgi:hypothetical protein
LVGKEIIVLIVGLVSILFGVSSLHSLYVQYKVLKEKNRVSWLVISEIIFDSQFLRGLGGVVFGLVLVLLYLLLLFGIA